MLFWDFIVFETERYKISKLLLIFCAKSNNNRPFYSYKKFNIPIINWLNKNDQYLNLQFGRQITGKATILILNTLCILSNKHS